MCGKLVVLLLQLASIYAAPLNLQVLHPLHQNMVDPSQLLQQQLLELQQLQGLQQRSDWSQIRVPPVIILLPTQTATTKIEDITNKSAQLKTADKEIINEDLDSITIEAESEAVEPQRVLVLPSYARLSIGDIISAIPFLPIEINVPDTIGWAYNGISSGIASIISIFGRIPFVSNTKRPSDEIRLKLALQMLDTRKQNNFVPSVLMPILPQAVSIQLPIQV